MSLLIYSGGQTFSFGANDYPDGGLYGPMRKHYVQILMVAEGAARISTSSGQRDIDAGHAALILNLEPVTFEYPRGRPTTVSWCETSPPVMSRLSLQLLSQEANVIPIDARLETLIHLGVELGSESGTRVNELRNLLGNSLYSAFFLALERGRHRGAVPDSIARAKMFMDMNYRQPIDVQDVVKAAGVSRQHLSTSFSHFFGITPSRYIWQLRASAAASMLMQTSFTVAKIAYDCGYKDPFHFSRHIRTVFGVPPRELRQRRGFRESSRFDDDVQDIRYELESDRLKEGATQGRNG